jgi:drug/metabolite transporter (DMT)-like permease
MLWITAALGTAAVFAASSMFAYEAARGLGAVVFSFMRTTLAAVGFLFAIAILGWDWSLAPFDIFLLAMSGVTGVFLADSLRYAALARLGPRVNALVHTTSVPFSLLCGAVFLGQYVTGASLIGTLTVFVGIVIAIAFRSGSNATAWEGNPDQLVVGVLLALAAAMAFSVSLLLAAPVMQRGVDPISATAVRAVAGAVTTVFPAVFMRSNRRQMAGLNRRLALQVIMSGIFGTGIGLTLQLFALANGPVGIVSALSSSTPILLVPMVWIASGHRPAVTAWTGALVAVAGTVMIYLGEL